MLAPALLALSLLPASGDPDEAYISLRDEIRVLDLSTGTFEVFTTGVQTPFYGEWGPEEGASQERFLYMPDTNFRAVWKIDGTGAKELLSFRGLLQAPIQAAFHPTTQELYVSDGLAQAVLVIDAQTGGQTVFADNAAGHFDYPGGIGFAPDGTLYVADAVNGGVFEVDAAGQVLPFFDGAAEGYSQMAGVQVDGAGNVFVATYDQHEVLRLRRDRDGWEVFARDPTMLEPNDIKLSRDGGLLVCAAESYSLCRLDPLGTVSVLGQDSGHGEWFGVCVPGDHPACDGTIEEFGVGTAGSGGFVPRISGIYTPCPGLPVGYFIERGLGGAAGFALYGTDEGSLPEFGGTIYVDFAGFWGLRPVRLGGSGPGQGSFRWTAQFPADPALTGFQFVMQALIFDDLGPTGISMSNAVRTTFGQ